jgi:hypothetical protein
MRKKRTANIGASSGDYQVPRGPLDLDNISILKSASGLTYLEFVQRYECPPKDSGDYFDAGPMPSILVLKMKVMSPNHLFGYSTLQAAFNRPKLKELADIRAEVEKKAGDDGDEGLAAWLLRRPVFGSSLLAISQVKSMPAWSKGMKSILAGASSNTGQPMKMILKIHMEETLLAHIQDGGGWRKLLEDDVQEWYEWLGKEIEKTRGKLT